MMRVIAILAIVAGFACIIVTLIGLLSDFRDWLRGEDWEVWGNRVKPNTEQNSSGHCTPKA